MRWAHQQHIKLFHVCRIHPAADDEEDRKSLSLKKKTVESHIRLEWKRVSFLTCWPEQKKKTQNEKHCILCWVGFWRYSSKCRDVMWWKRVKLCRERYKRADEVTTLQQRYSIIQRQNLCRLLFAAFWWEIATIFGLDIIWEREREDWRTQQGQWNQHPLRLKMPQFSIIKASSLAMIWELLLLLLKIWKFYSRISLQFRIVESFSIYFISFHCLLSWSLPKSSLVHAQEEKSPTRINAERQTHKRMEKSFPTLQPICWAARCFSFLTHHKIHIQVNTFLLCR